MPQLQIHDRLSSLCPRSRNGPEEGYYGSVSGVEMTPARGDGIVEW